MTLLRPLLAACLSALPILALAASLESDAQRVDAEHIDRDPAWLALLHYRIQHGGGMESEADRTHFFMAADGKRSPRAELLAAVTALHAPGQRQQFACRFPARYEWLRTRLGYDNAGAAIERCPQLARWLAGFPGRRISISFASSYLENPSSTFGHTFLRIFEHASSELMSPTINYAARTDARDSDLAFVVKGLSGGFPGVADELPFYRRLRTYTEIEGRDIHEYDLALAPDEVRRVLLHTWEIKDGIFDYYFVRENCAYRTLALLDVVRPHAGLLRRFTAATVPVDTIRALRAAHMLGAHRVWPSLSKRVRDLEAQVPTQQAVAAQDMARGQASILSAGHHADTLQLAYEYSSVLIDRDEGERASRKEIFGAIAKARLAFENAEPLASHAAMTNPEAGHDGALMAIGTRRRGGKNAVSLEYAAFQHILTNPLPGYEPHAEISVLNPELQVQDGHVSMRRIDWLTAQSAIPSTALFQPRAWRLQLSTRSEPFAARDHLATSLAYHSGKAWLLGRDTVVAILPGARVEASRALGHDAAMAGAVHAALTHQTTQWSAQLEMQAIKFFAGSTLSRRSAQVTGEAGLSRNVSVAVSAVQSWAPRRERELRIDLKWRHRSLSIPVRAN